MDFLAQYSNVFIIIIACGGYVVLIERRLTKVETLLRVVQEQIERLFNLYAK